MPSEKLQTYSLKKTAILCRLGLSIVFGGIAHAQELYWDINGTVPGPGGTALNALDGTWSSAATNWNTDDEGGTGTISGWISGANPRFNARLDSQLGQYQSYTVSLAESLSIGTYMEYVWGAPGSRLTITNAAGGPFAISVTDLDLVIGPDLTLEVVPSFTARESSISPHQEPCACWEGRIRFLESRRMMAPWKLSTRAVSSKA